MSRRYDETHPRGAEGGADGERLAEIALPKRGEKYVAYDTWRPSCRVFITVTRVAKDGSWADCQMQTWATGWTKRMPLFDGQFSDQADLTRRDWDWHDLNEQEIDHIAKLRDEGVLPPLDGSTSGKTYGGDE